jgi:hypothetical protein
MIYKFGEHIKESKKYEFQIRDIGGNVYYKRKKGNKIWEFTTEEDFIKNSNDDNVISWLKDVDIDTKKIKDKKLMKHLKKFENFDGVLAYDAGANAAVYRYNNANPAIELEDSVDNGKDDDRNPNYMVIQNLKTVIEQSKEMLEILSDSELEEWAKDHIATSKDDIEEVYNYIKHKK